MPLIWGQVYLLRNCSTCPYDSAQMGSLALSNTTLSFPAFLSDIVGQGRPVQGGGEECGLRKKLGWSLDYAIICWPVLSKWLNLSEPPFSQSGNGARITYFIVLRWGINDTVSIYYLLHLRNWYWHKKSPVLEVLSHLSAPTPPLSVQLPCLSHTLVSLYL